LVADDNEFNLFTLQQVLLTFNLNADGAFNGKEAAEMAEKSLSCCPYKIIFMD
jgi:CheY-like chemotaxis protein